MPNARGQGRGRGRGQLYEADDKTKAERRSNKIKLYIVRIVLFLTVNVLYSRQFANKAFKVRQITVPKINEIETSFSPKC